MFALAVGDRDVVHMAMGKGVVRRYERCGAAECCRW